MSKQQLSIYDRLRLDLGPFLRSYSTLGESSTVLGVSRQGGVTLVLKMCAYNRMEPHCYLHTVPCTHVCTLMCADNNNQQREPDCCGATLYSRLALPATKYGLPLLSVVLCCYRLLPFRCTSPSHKYIAACMVGWPWDNWAVRLYHIFSRVVTSLFGDARLLHGPLFWTLSDRWHCLRW